MIPPPIRQEDASTERRIVIVDVEWTSWDGARQRFWSGPTEDIEIVQIGAIALTPDEGLSESGHFEALVRPRIHHRLDPYFTTLTGITQDDVDQDGIDLKTALHRFRDFVRPATDAFFSFGDDSWVIRMNCQLYGLANPVDVGPYHNLRPPIRTALDAPTLDSSDLPDAMGFAPPGSRHHGLSDCRCTAEAIRRLTDVRHHVRHCLQPDPTIPPT